MQPSITHSNVSTSAKSDCSQLEQPIDDASDSPPAAAFKPFHLDHLSESTASGPNTTIDSLAEVELDLRIELGRTEMSLQDVLQLRDGSVIALDSFAGDPVNVFVNNRIVARGEILVMNDHFCIRVTELVGA